MATKNTSNTADTSNTSDKREPVAEKFSQFEENYGGDAVNAHDNRMDSILHDNAEQLDRKYSSKDGNDA